MIRLLHLSDFHFSSEPDKLNKWDALRGEGIGDNQEFRARVGFFQTSHNFDLPARISEFVKSEDVDLLIVTGDLAATGLRKDLMFARAYFVSSNPAGVPAYPNLRFPKERLFLMPGNHDRFQYGGGVIDDLAEAVSPGNLEFDDAFSDFWYSRCSDYRVAEMDIPGAHGELPPATVIAADFCLSLRSQAENAFHGVFAGFAGQGFADERVLRALMEATRRKRSKHEAAIIIWLIHFPPFSLAELAANERSLRLINSEAVMQAAHECGVPLILSGHLHRDFCCPDYGYVRVWCAGAAAVRSARQYQIHEISLSSPTAPWVIASRKTFTLRRIPGEDWQFVGDDTEPVTHAWRADVASFSS